MKSLHCLTTQVEGQKGADLFRLYLVTMKILLLVVALHHTVFSPRLPPCASSEKFHLIQSKSHHVVISNFSADQTKLF